MPQFEPGTQKTAIAPITVSPAGLSCEAELFLGPNDTTPVATSGRIPFTSLGSQQQVDLPVTMPSDPDTYHVYIDLYVEGMYFAGYQALEDVVIAAPALPFSMSITKIETIPSNKYASAYWLMQPNILVSNPHSVPVSHKLYCGWAFGSRDPNLLSSYAFTRCWGGGAPGTPANELYELSVTLEPGQSVTLVSPFYYIDGLWGWDRANPYEWSNLPDGMYSGGVRKKYYFRVIDELGNWSPVMSVGSA